MAVALGVAVCGLGWALWHYLFPEPGPRVRAIASASTSAARTGSVRSVAPGRWLGGPTAGADGYAVADRPREMRFPADHGPHPGFRTEWWYLTGNLAVEASAARPPTRRFGYQITFFRLQPSPRGGGDLYLAHFAVTDVEAQRFVAFERLGRSDLGVAGATAAPLAVWVDGWRLEAASRPRQTDPGGSTASTTEAPALRGLTVRASDREADGTEVALVLALDVVRPMILQGDRGLSRKGAAPGAASYYYSNTRLPTRGAIRIGGRSHAVAGTSWLDREWSTSALGEDQAGWDWFALHLDDGTDLMFYQLRDRAGRAQRFSAGSVVLPSGELDRLGVRDVSVEVQEHWESPSGARYPSRWRLAVPRHRIDVSIRPVVAAQEWRATVQYWEGAVALTRGTGGSPAGYGYVEMTGY